MAYFSGFLQRIKQQNNKIANVLGGNSAINLLIWAILIVPASFISICYGIICTALGKGGLNQAFGEEKEGVGIPDGDQNKTIVDDAMDHETKDHETKDHETKDKPLSSENTEDTVEKPSFKHSNDTETKDHETKDKPLSSENTEDTVEKPSFKHSNDTILKLYDEIGARELLYTHIVQEQLLSIGMFSERGNDWNRLADLYKQKTYCMPDNIQLLNIEDVYNFLTDQERCNLSNIAVDAEKLNLIADIANNRLPATGSCECIKLHYQVPKLDENKDAIVCKEESAIFLRDFTTDPMKTTKLASCEGNIGSGYLKPEKEIAIKPLNADFFNTLVKGDDKLASLRLSEDYMNNYRNDNPSLPSVTNIESERPPKSNLNGHGKDNPMLGNQTNL